MSRLTLQSIVYVDDDSDICEIVRASLGLIAGMEVRTAASGERAIEIALERPPDLFLLDMMMPGLDGPSTLKRIRETSALKSIPVIFLTAKVMPREIGEVLKLGAIGIIAKPFDPLKLTENILALWNNDVPSCSIVSSSVGQLFSHNDPLTESFLERARTDVIRVLEQLSRIRRGERVVLNEAARVAHSLHGAGALFGFLGVSVAAGALEWLIDSVMATVSIQQLLPESGLLLQLEDCAARLAGAIAVAAQVAPNRTGMFQ